MIENEQEKIDSLSSFSRGMQEKSSRFLQQPNEVRYAQNARFGEIGGIASAFGFEQPNSDLTSTTSTSTSSSTTTTSTSSSTSTSTTTSTSTS